MNFPLTPSFREGDHESYTHVRKVFLYPILLLLRSCWMSAQDDTLLVLHGFVAESLKSSVQYDAGLLTWTLHLVSFRLSLKQAGTFRLNSDALLPLLCTKTLDLSFRLRFFAVASHFLAVSIAAAVASLKALPSLSASS